MFLVWVVIACVFLALELFLPSLFLFLSFSVGSFVAALMSLNYSMHLQVLTGIISTLITMFILGYWIRRHERKQKSLYETNVFNLIGKEGVIIELPSNTFGFGLVSIQGQIWSCRIENSSFRLLTPGQRVRVINISGAHLIVRPIIGEFA